jgi:hypothetical protein
MQGPGADVPYKVRMLNVQNQHISEGFSVL